MSQLLLEKPTNLNLGGRDTSIPGFCTVDLRPGPSVGLVADISKLDMIETDSIEEIYASHCLEHFWHTKTVDVLKEWHRVLKTNGKAFISVPDTLACLEFLKSEPAADWPYHMLYGNQGGGEFEFHYITFTFPMLARKCVEAGFSDIKKIKKMPYGITDSSSMVDTYYKKPVSVNVECIK